MQKYLDVLGPTKRMYVSNEKEKKKGGRKKMDQYEVHWQICPMMCKKFCILSVLLWTPVSHDTYNLNLSVVVVIA